MGQLDADARFADQASALACIGATGVEDLDRHDPVPLGVEDAIGVTLTESFAMSPGASVSGWYFSHPGARYFGVGRLGRDQVHDYAARKGWLVSEAEQWLAPNLGYEPGGDR